MPEKIGFQTTRETAIIRTPQLQVMLTRWDWTLGQPLDNTPFDMTNFVIRYQFQKTIKTPAGGCQIDVVPQIGDIHFMDYISTMDVVQIFEFGVLKYSGYVRRVSAVGRIMPDGKPVRLVTVVLQSFGNLFLEGHLGLNMFMRISDTANLNNIMLQFAGQITDTINGGGSYGDLISTLINQWLNYVGLASGSTFYQQYISSWLETVSGTLGKRIPGAPKDTQIIYPFSEDMTLWDILQRTIEVPITELWFDEGPRSVQIEQDQSLTQPTEVRLPNSITYLVCRQTPFNGTTINGDSVNMFDNMPSRKIPINYLTGYELNKSMDESYSFYLASPAIWKPGGDAGDPSAAMAMVATGQYVFDSLAFSKYLYRPLQKDMFFDRYFDSSSPNLDGSIGQLNQNALDFADTLFEWFSNNDQFLNGSFTIEVPSDESLDPRIGDKIEFDGINDAYFYVEGITHDFIYGGPITSTLMVTRGYGLGRPISLQDKLFKRGRFALGNQFDAPK